MFYFMGREGFTRGVLVIVTKQTNNFRATVVTLGDKVIESSV